jgi:hypothetical protein
MGDHAIVTHGHWGIAVLVCALGGTSAGRGIACGAEAENPAVPRHDAGVVNDAGINTTGVGAGTGADTGLPCDVQQLLENRCIGCHLSKSPPPLLTLADLVAPSASDPSKSMAAASLARMQSATSPMPPSPAEAPTPEEIQIFAAWVSANLPKGAACTSAAGGAAASYATPTVCTSGKTWSGGNDGSSSMRPGGACLTCHAMRGGPAYKIAGTVYPSAHEPDDCDGVPGGITVVVTGGDGTTTSLPVNSVGNFYSRGSPVAPFHVKVTNGTKERAMTAAVTAGDCNTCHTEQGANGAPGRIMAP